MPPSPVVAIPDANLRTAIEDFLDKPGGEPITQTEMAKFRGFSPTSESISDLTGLEYAINLTFLQLWGNNISDISPLVANTGLGSGDEVNLKSNPLSSVSINTHIPALQRRGVTVEF